jgi:hypothetical protein
MRVHANFSSEMAVESTEGLVIADLPPRRRLADCLGVRWLLR